MIHCEYPVIGSYCHWSLFLHSSSKIIYHTSVTGDDTVIVESNFSSQDSFVKKKLKHVFKLEDRNMTGI